MIQSTWESEKFRIASAAPPSEAVSIVTKPLPDGSLKIVAQDEKTDDTEKQS